MHLSYICAIVTFHLPRTHLAQLMPADGRDGRGMERADGALVEEARSGPVIKYNYFCLVESVFFEDVFV